MMKYKQSHHNLKQQQQQQASSRTTTTAVVIGGNPSIIEPQKISRPSITLRESCSSTFVPIEKPSHDESDQSDELMHHDPHSTSSFVSPVLPEQDPDYDYEQHTKMPPAPPQKKRKQQQQQYSSTRETSRSSSVSSAQVQDNNDVSNNINGEFDSVASLPTPSILETVEQAAAVVLLAMRRNSTASSSSSSCRSSSSSSQCWVQVGHQDKNIFSPRSAYPCKILEDSDTSVDDDDDSGDMMAMDLQQSSSEEEERAVVVLHRPKPSKKKTKKESDEVSIVIRSSKRKREPKQLYYKAIVQDSIMSSPTTPSSKTTTTATTTTASTTTNTVTPPTKNKNGSIFGLRLGAPDDPQYLNSLHCFVRAELLEFFSISDVKKLPPSSPASSRNTSSSSIHNNKPQRVGLRCVYCAQNSSKSERGTTMSTFAPKSLVELYRSVCTWQRLHFKSCPCIPQQVQDTYWKLKYADRTRGRKSHWIDSAKKLGLVDSAECHRGGIFWNPTTTTVSSLEQPPPEEDEDEDEKVHFI
jgi:hypothetical protein